MYMYMIYPPIHQSLDMPSIPTRHSPFYTCALYVKLCPCRDDLARAIKKLRILGAGFAVIPMKGGRLVQSVPGELNMDHTAVLQKAEVRKEAAIDGCTALQPSITM